MFSVLQCAVIGKSLSLLKWLVEDNCCPLKSIRIGSGGRGAKADYYTPILTSKSRSLLNIALSNKSIDIVRYLVVEKRMSLQDERDIPTEVLLQALDSILRVLPPDDDNEETLDEHQNSIVSSAINTSARNAINSESTSSFASEIVDNNFDSENATNVKSEDSRDSTPNNEVGTSEDRLYCSFVSRSIALQIHFVFFISTLLVYTMLLESNRFCSDAMWASNVLLGMQQKHFSLPCLPNRMLVCPGLSSINWIVFVNYCHIFM